MAKPVNEELLIKTREFYDLYRDVYRNARSFAIAYLNQNPHIKVSIQYAAMFFLDYMDEGKAEAKKRISKPSSKIQKLQRSKESLKSETQPTGFDRVIEETGNTKTISQKTEVRITSLQEAIDFFEIDTKEWEVSHWKCKSWDTSMKVDEIIDGKIVTKPVVRTNYLVNVQLKKRFDEINYEKIKEQLDDFIIGKAPAKAKGNKIGVLTIADLHTGLNVKQLTEHTQEFNIKKLLQYLEEASFIINDFKYEEVYLNILGDIVESVTGYNKIETLKEMEQGLQGGNLIISAYEIIHKFARSINNLQEINMISGNHDRLTPDKAMDKDGGAAQLVAYMLSKDIKTNWHPLVIKRIIDNICYLLMHGDHKLAKQDLGKLVFEYGDQSLYNVLLSGHWHTRKSTKLFRESNLVLADTSKYRAITVSPIVTGNRWVEENGWSCSAGITITEASKDKRNINYYDIALSR